MPTPHWRKSSFSGEGNNCLNLASAADGTIRLRESEAPRHGPHHHPRPARRLHTRRQGR
ncbi:DUF397 domain-containing protein [Streptomyces sp. ME19-01-6]|uniref:DUF397 domain-containing protein n=1 Tax=Streptomyces sp. ME19-01-6 TaxID=3028686 RepID=UPI0039F4F213